ncbi:HlyD family secretion protein [Vibrio mediterranei]|uniref:HlyD family secretion protein n=1 Tax=Vibrio mediterranei TaxID=689 RepID=UPI00148C78D8|nr:HlyD family secretion protein [Vibrio mediterranei]NOH27272.1 HlyD family secretion protein [Vibrio mediterranei]
MKVDAIVFSKYVVRSIVGFIGLMGVVVILSDIYAPYTTQSQIQMPTTNVHPQVSGNIVHINVVNGQAVSKGDLLYSIDPREYLLKLESAKANLAAAMSELGNLKSQLLVDRSLLSQQKALYQQSLSHFERFRRLYNKKQISADQFEQAKSSKESNFYLVQQKQAEIQKTMSQIGPPGKNPKVLQAKSALASAELNLDRTRVKSGGTGVVSNLQISDGDFVSSNSNTLVIVDFEQQYLTANFNEKGLDQLIIGSSVSIVFDSAPGTIFHGRIASLDRAIQSGVGQTGQLAQMSNSDRWIRKSEQFPVRIKVVNPPKNLIAGSKATVMAQRGDSPFWGSMSSLLMHTMAVLRYVY